MNLDALLEPVKRQAKPCRIAEIVASLEEPYKSALQNLLDTSYADGGLSDAHVASRMREAGLPASHTTVRYHRRGLCGCSKAAK